MQLFRKLKRNTGYRSVQLARNIGYARIRDPFYMHHLKKHYGISEMWRVSTGKAFRFLAISRMVGYSTIFEEPYIWVFESNAKRPANFFLEWEDSINRRCYFEAPRWFIDYRKMQKQKGENSYRIKINKFKSREFSVWDLLS